MLTEKSQILVAKPPKRPCRPGYTRLNGAITGPEIHSIIDAQERAQAANRLLAEVRRAALVLAHWAQQLGAASDNANDSVSNAVGAGGQRSPGRQSERG